jgi:hypothetical protein
MPTRRCTDRRFSTNLLEPSKAVCGNRKHNVADCDIEMTTEHEIDRNENGYPHRNLDDTHHRHQRVVAEIGRSC